MRIAHGHVDEDALEDDKGAAGVDGDADDGDDPMDGRVGRPGEDEEADDGAEDADQSGHEAVFLRAHAVGEDVRDEVEVEVGDVGGDAEDAGDEDAEEDDARLADAEAVHGAVDEGEDFEEGVVDCVDDGGVDVDKGDGRVFDGDFEGFDQGVQGDGGGSEVPLGDFRMGHETVGVGQGAEPGGAAEEDVGGGGFGEEEKHGNEDGGGDPDDFPEGPAPAFNGDGKSG